MCKNGVVMNRYYLMNKNEKIIEFDVQEKLGGEICSEIQSFSKIRPIGFSDIHTWIIQRDYAKHKEHLKRWLHEWGIDTIQGFINVTHCLGLNDAFWVKSINSSLIWDEINLYQNPFDDVAQHTAFDTGLYGLKLSSTSPEFTAEGSFAKCWIQKNDTVVLYKQGATGASNVGLEPYAEYLSSNIGHQIFGDKVLPYGLEMFKDRLCSVCNLFTTEEIGFVPFYRVLPQNRAYTIEALIKFCRELGFEQDFRRMILLDSIVFNQDRHTGNFGFMVENETQRIISFAPLFDFNVSMLCNAVPEDLLDYDKYEKEYMVGHKLGGLFSEVGAGIMTDELRQQLPEQIELPHHPLYNMDSNRLKQLQKIVDRNYDKVINKSSICIVKNREERSPKM